MLLSTVGLRKTGNSMRVANQNGYWDYWRSYGEACGLLQFKRCWYLMLEGRHMN